MCEISGGTRARHRSRRVDLPDTDTGHSNQSVPVLFAPLFLDGRYTALTSARAGRLNAGLLGEEPDTSDVWRQRVATREVVAMVDFMAPPNVRELAWRAVRDGEM